MAVEAINLEESVDEFLQYFDKARLEVEILELESLLSSNSERKVEAVQKIFRDIHSLKGSAGLLKLQWANDFLHTFEDALGIVSKNIHQIVGVSRTEVFDFFLGGLDLIERLARGCAENPDAKLKDQKGLFSFYIRLTLDARDLMENREQYLKFSELDEDLF